MRRLPWLNRSMMRKLLWFVGLYLVSVIVVAGVAYGLRALLFIQKP